MNGLPGAMNLNKIDLNLFVVFDTIYTEGNLTRAGEILCITQPAVSNALARLRDTFNDPLFVRTGQRMTPTPMAQNIIEPVRDALQLLRHCVQEGEQFLPATADRLYRLSMGDMTEAMLLPSLFRRMRSASPRVRIQVFQAQREELAKEMAAGRLDFALDIPTLADPQLLHTPLLEDRYVCAVRRGHPLLEGGLTLERYLQLEHLHVSSRRSGMGYVDVALNQLGERRHIALRVQHHLTAPDIVRHSDLALSLPNTLARQFDLQLFELPFAVAPLELHLYWHKSADRDQANQWMRGLILQSCQGSS